MKLGHNLASVGLGIVIAWVALLFIPRPVPTVSYFYQAPVEGSPIDNPQAQSLVAVGLLAPKKSVMDSPEKKELKPPKPAPTVPEHVQEPPAEVGPPLQAQPPTGPAAVKPQSTEMTSVAPAAPAPPPPPPPSAPAPPPPPAAAPAAPPPSAPAPPATPVPSPVSPTTSNFEFAPF
jgi:hypothetical protein